MAQKILIIEDDQQYLDILSRKLQHAGYAVVEAHDGNEALVKLESDGIDLILLDLLMPKMSGWNFMYKLKDTKHKSTPVVILTNLNQGSYPNEPVVVLDYLVKSNTSLDDVVGKIDKYLGQKG